MMIRTKEGPFGLSIHHFRGSALSQVWPLVLVVVGLSVGIELAWSPLGLDDFSLTTTPFTLIGVALSIFLGFRNNACYDRYWEARKQWGTLVNTSRTFARRAAMLVPGGSTLGRTLVHRQIAFVHALRIHLRGSGDWRELEGLLPDDEIAGLGAESNPPSAISHRTGALLRDAWAAGDVDTFHLPLLEGCLATNTDVQGACERIKNTPLPMSYTILTHRIVGLYCLALPFGIHDAVGPLAPVVTGFVAFAFLGLDAIGTEIEDPFEVDPNDLPLSQLSRMVEIDLRQRLGETPPEPVVPVDGFVH